MHAIVLLLVLLGAGTSGKSSVRADAAPQVEKEIKDLEFHLAGLLMRGEFDTYSTFLADDYTRISEQGVVETREEVLRAFRGAHGTGTMEPTDLAVQTYGDTAILTGLLRWEWPTEGATASGVSRFRKVFIRRAGRWYLVSLQGVSYSKP